MNRIRTSAAALKGLPPRANPGLWPCPLCRVLESPFGRVLESYEPPSHPSTSRCSEPWPRDGSSRLHFLALWPASAYAAARLYAESANSDFKQGQAAEARDDYDTAFDLYQKAYNRDPKDARFQIALARIRTTASSAHITKGRKLLQAGDVQGALV